MAVMSAAPAEEGGKGREGKGRGNKTRSEQQPTSNININININPQTQTSLKSPTSFNLHINTYNPTILPSSIQRSLLISSINSENCYALHDTIQYNTTVLLYRGTSSTHRTYNDRSI